jgi:hypothetical protein
LSSKVTSGGRSFSVGGFFDLLIVTFSISISNALEMDERARHAVEMRRRGIRERIVGYSGRIYYPY